jgi:hypothetical protein
MLPHHKKATSTVSINCSKVNDSFFAITNIFNFFYLMPTTYQIQSCSNVTPNNIQNDFLYDFPDDFHYDFSDDFSSMVPPWFLQCSSNVPPIGGGGGQTSGNSAKTGLCMQQIKKVRKAVYTCLSTAFGALLTKTDRPTIFMANFSSTTFGNISGRHGTAVAVVQKDGTNVLRVFRKPFNPNSPKQVAHRLKFSLVNKELAPLRQVVTLGNKGDAGAFRKVVGKTLTEAITGEYPDFTIDFNRVQLTTGTLQSVERAEATVTEGTAEVNITWDTTLGFQSRLGADNDEVNFICFNPESRMVLPFTKAALRSEGSASLTLPEIWKGNTIHTWLFLTSADGLYVSDSISMADVQL